MKVCFVMLYIESWGLGKVLWWFKPLLWCWMKLGKYLDSTWMHLSHVGSLLTLGEYFDAWISPGSTWVRTILFPPLDSVDPTELEQYITSKFTVLNLGLRNCPWNSSPLDFVLLFMTTDMWTHIVSETDKNAQAVLRQRHVIGTRATFQTRKVSWRNGWRYDKPPSHWDKHGGSELGRISQIIWIVMTLKLSHFIQKHCPWNDWNLCRCFIYHLMSLHSEVNHWMKIRDFVNMINESFKKYLVLWEEVRIGESMIGMKKQLFFHLLHAETCSFWNKEIWDVWCFHFLRSPCFFV